MMPKVVRWPSPADVTLAIAFVVVAEVELRVSNQNVLAGRVPVAMDSLLVAVPLVATAWRRAAPFAACASVATGLTLVGAGLGGTICFFGGLFPFLVSVYSASAWAAAHWDRVSVAVPVGLMIPMHWYISDFRIPTDLFFGLTLSAMAWLAGQAARRWRQQSQRLAVALDEARAGRAAVAELAVAEERARIARELHDVVAHGMSVVVMQAGVARLDLAAGDERAADAALSRIENAGRVGLLEMRRLLGLMRRDEPTVLAPQPTLADLDELVAGLERAGLSVRWQHLGTPQPLPDAAELSAYRIVQEGLTNALRHGADHRARLELRWDDQSLRIEITNRCDPRPLTDGTGHGLVGIGERAALFGGAAGTQVRDGVHHLVASLPYAPGAAAATLAPECER
ncbi:MAG: sensor histidine kinase [Angustibacter sp.]